MKKAMILAVVAVVLGISAPSTFAQVPGSSQPSSTTEDERDQSTQPSAPSTQPGTEQGVSTGTHESMAGQYTEEVKAADLPAAITRSLNEKYPGFKTDKAYRGKDGTFKVKVSKGEDNQVLFFDARGEALKIQK